MGLLSTLQRSNSAHVNGADSARDSAICRDRDVSERLKTKQLLNKMATTITKTPPTHMQTLDFSFSFTSLQEPLSLCALVARETVHVLKMTRL